MSATATQPRHVFLSHNRNHKPWVRRVAAQWRDLGLRVFFDEDSIEPGENLVSAIERGITGCDHVVLMLSPAALASDWVAMEVAMSRTSDPSGNGRKLIPVLIEPMDMDNIRPAIRCLSIVDLTHPEQRTQQYHHLLRSLGLHDRTLPAAPPFEDTPALPGGVSGSDSAWEEQGRPVGEPTRRVGLELTIDGDLEHFSTEQQLNLVAAIKALLGTGDDLTIRNVRRGSIILTLDLSPDDAKELSSAVAHGELSELGFRGARILTEAGTAARGDESVPAAPTASPSLKEALNPETIFLRHLGWINRVAAMTCRQHGVWDAEAEDFAGWVRIKLMEDQYAAIRKFRGDSGLKTYLASWVIRQFFEYQRERRGRWRTSAVAERLGPPAPELEILVYRDGYRLEQAGEKLRTSGRTTLSDAELARLLERVPRRAPLRPVQVPSGTVLDTAEGSSRADERVAAAEAEEQHGRVMGALDRAMNRLETEDRLIMRMHFQEGKTLALVARALGLEQKPLYRRVERLRKVLQGYLEDEGVREADVRTMVWDDGTP